jgi:hypothetical protein
MTVKELENELERVDLAASRTHEADMDKLIARGVWQIALQLARLVEGVENTK